MTEVSAFTINQWEKDLMVFSLPASVLLDISYFNAREQDRQTGIQREFNISRSKEIAEYIDSGDAILANNIIVNLNLAKLNIDYNAIFDAKRGLLNIEVLKERIKAAKDIEEKKPVDKQDKMLLRGKIAHVIDGQHRLRAFEYSSNKDFPVVVVALFDLSLSEVAEIFVKINFYQKPVNKSLVFDLLGINPELFPEYFMLHNVVEKLNTDVNSPFYSNIKMLGAGSGFVTQASLITAIEKYKIYSMLESCFKGFNEDMLYEILWHYFKGVSEAFPEHWGEKKLFCKSIGIRALLKFLEDVIGYMMSNQYSNFDSKEIRDLLRKTIDMTQVAQGSIGLGGESGVKQLHKLLQESLAKNADSAVRRA